MRKSLFACLGMFLLLGMRGHSDHTVPLLYAKYLHCFQDEMPETQLDSLREYVDHFLLLEKTISVPFRKDVSIVVVDDEKMRISEHLQTYFDCDGLHKPQEELIRDTIPSAISDYDEFEVALNAKLSKLKRFDSRHARRRMLSPLFDGVVFSISHCKEGRCKTWVFDNPETYWGMDSSISRLRSFIEFKEFLEESLGIDVVGI
ncbi:hypothetical protein [Pontibacter sp. G13]|uniref:hypothetical protein n=1 Tax=Pontibacter sp. G13 TaxID=3074898 RepID=UPI00288A4090|nr:hypothetical protein [Pontibacter sp. G13]WNJ18282.1 hypothetical protein RJD25_25805 [Pontibacter sp. G13]